MSEAALRETNRKKTKDQMKTIKNYTIKKTSEILTWQRPLSEDHQGYPRNVAETRRTLENFIFLFACNDSEESSPKIRCFVFCSLTNTFANLLGSGHSYDADVFNKIIRKLPFSKNSTRGESARFFGGRTRICSRDLIPVLSHCHSKKHNLYHEQSSHSRSDR